jgi:hypothetical protein
LSKRPAIDTPPDAIGGLENEYVVTVCNEVLDGIKPGTTGADNDHIMRSVFCPGDG